MFGYEVLQAYNELEMLVYNYIMDHKEEVKYMTIRELSNAVHVSTSTIIRFCKKTVVMATRNFVCSSNSF